MLDQPEESARTEAGLTCRRCGHIYLDRYDLDNLPQRPDQAMTLGLYLGAAMLTHLVKAHQVTIGGPSS
ncbi:MAG: hypothetical protein QOG31_237 [Thermoplasmata archaeon]|jgi:hypothetical protein|nr:hypothetical protein [Thermoplasmata archaeon]